MSFKQSSTVIRAMVCTSGRRFSGDPFGGALPLPGEPQARSADDGCQVRERHVEIFVYYNIIELIRMAYLVARRGKPLFDDGVAVLAPVAQAAFQFFHGRRQNENAD